MHPQFWSTWEDFEVKHGNEDTVREMLRVKRSVQASYNTRVNYMSYQMHAGAAGSGANGEGQTLAGELNAADKMAQLEAQAQQMLAMEKGMAATTVGSGKISFVRGESRSTKAVATENPAEINIDDIEMEADE